MKLDDPGDECYNELADKGYIVEHTTVYEDELGIVHVLDEEPEGNVFVSGRSEEGQSQAGWVFDGRWPTAEEIYERFSGEGQ